MTGQHFILQIFGWALLHSLWQMALLWVVYRFITAVFTGLKSSQKTSLASIFIMGGFIWFVVTLLLLWNNIIPENRTAIRKAIKNGVKVKHGKGISLLDKFTEIYNNSMDHNKAEDYYYFEMDFYKSIHKDLHDNYYLFLCVFSSAYGVRILG